MSELRKLSDNSIVLLSVVAVARRDPSPDYRNDAYYALLNGGHEILITRAEYDRLSLYIAAKNGIEWERVIAHDPNSTPVYHDDGTIAEIRGRLGSVKP